MTLQFGPKGIITPHNLGGATEIRSFAVPDGLVGYWGLDFDCWDGTTAVDLVGNNNLTRTGTTPIVVSGKIGGAAQFTGANNNYIGNATPNSMIPSGVCAVSLSCWFKLNSTTMPDGYFEPFGLGNNNANQSRFAVYLDASNVMAEMRNNGVSTPWTPDTLTHHMVITQNGGAINTGSSIYFDAVKKTVSGGSGSTLALPSPCQVTIGGLWVSAGSAVGTVNGWVDDCRVYNRELSYVEVLELYNAGIAGRRTRQFSQWLEMPMLSPSLEHFWQLYFSKNSGTYEPVTTTSVGVKAADASSDADGTIILIPRLS